MTTQNESVKFEELVSHVLQSIVQFPEALEIKSREQARGGSQISAKVHPDDVGRVIGKGGSTITAIRAVLEFAARRQGDNASFDIENA